MRTSRFALLVHTLLFVSAANWSAIVPLLPRLSRAYGLPPTGSAILLAAPGLTTLAVSVPVGVLTDRLGAKRVTILATLLLALGVLGQAIPVYPALVAGRIVFGLAFGTLWTTAIAWLSGAQTQGSHLGATAMSAAAGMIAGPALGGIVADQLGLAAPFLIVAAAALMLAAALVRQPGVTPAARGRDSVRALARVAPRQAGVRTGALALAISGAVGGVTQLLIPLQLHGLGFTASETGLVFSAAAGVYIVVSGVVVRIGARATTLRAAALAGLALALSLAPAAASGAAVVLVAVLAVSTVPRAVVSTIAYPLATISAAEAGLGDGLVIGLLNGTWAIGLVVAPLLAGLVDQLAGPAVAYLCTLGPAAVCALWLLARSSPPAASMPPTLEHVLGSA